MVKPKLMSSDRLSIISMTSEKSLSLMKVPLIMSGKGIEDRGF